MKMKLASFRQNGSCRAQSLYCAIDPPAPPSGAIRRLRPTSHVTAPAKTEPRAAGSGSLLLFRSLVLNSPAKTRGLIVNNNEIQERGNSAAKTAPARREDRK